MSFGFSVSDFVACIQLARKVWQERRDAPKDFHAVSNEVASLQLVLLRVQETINDKELSENNKDNLNTLVKGCNETLQELQALLKKYKSLGTQSRRTWDRLRWGAEQVEGIRQRVISNTGLLTSFNVGLIGSGMARIEAMLQQLMLERQSGLREGSVISIESIASAQEGDEDTWYQIGRELEDVGITPDMINEHRPYITAWIMEALSSGNLDEDPMLASPGLDTSSSELPRQAPLPHILQGRELITQDELAEDRNDVPHNTFDSRPEEAMDLGNTPDTSMEMEESLRPGDVTLSDIQRKGYLCTHASCQESPEQSFTSWFELLLHARNYHCAHAPPWSLSPNNSDFQAVSTPSDPSCLARAENGDWLSIESLQRSTSLSYELRLELNYMLTVLYEAVFSGSIPPEIPQLMYDLYYSTVCQFKDCQKSSKDSNEYRNHFIRHFVPYERTCASSDMLATADHGMRILDMKTVTRVQKHYLCAMRCGEDDPSFSDLAGLRAHYLKVHGFTTSTLSHSMLSKLSIDPYIKQSVGIPSTATHNQRNEYFRSSTLKDSTEWKKLKQELILFDSKLGLQQQAPTDPSRCLTWKDVQASIQLAENQYRAGKTGKTGEGTSSSRKRYSKLRNNYSTFPAGLSFLPVEYQAVLFRALNLVILSTSTIEACESMIKVLEEMPDWLSRATRYEEMYGNQEAKVMVQMIEKLYEATINFLRHCLWFNAQTTLKRSFKAIMHKQYLSNLSNFLRKGVKMIDEEASVLAQTRLKQLENPLQDNAPQSLDYYLVFSGKRLDSIAGAALTWSATQAWFWAVENTQ